MRNNSGAFTDATGRHVRYGLDNTSKKRNEQTKSSDLIGITTIVITPNMVGKIVGIFTAVECKKAEWNGVKDQREVAQQNFINWVVSHGGIAGFANSVDSFLKLLGK